MNKRWIIYEDGSLLVLNKPIDMVTMGTRDEVSLYSHAREYLESKDTKIKSQLFTVHRLDKESSGVVIFAKGHNMFNRLSLMFKKRFIDKEYLVKVHGNAREQLFTLNFPEEYLRYLKIINKNNIKLLEITLPIYGIKTKSRIDLKEGSPAYSRVKVINVEEKESLLSVELKSGRMHQIRCHLACLGLPVVGDNLYGKDDNEERLFLHAHRLSFRLAEKHYSFVAPIPQEFEVE